MSPRTLADFASSCDYCVVSYLSPDGAPQSAVVGFAITPVLEIIFDTVSSSRKYRNLKARPQCSIVLWSGSITIQYEGLAEEPSPADLDRYKEAYFAKLPDGRDRQAWPGIAYFVVRPKWIRYSDFTSRPPLIEEFSF
jgi:hypothetical protein